MKLRLFFIMIMFLLISAARAQFPGYQPSPGDTLHSLRIHKNNEVTLSFYAPNAKAVMVSGDFLSSYQPLALTKDAVGIWSVKTTVLTPDLYSYDFIVDGMKVLDPKNIQVKEGANGYSNLLEVPGAAADYQSIKNVPHGKVEQCWFHAESLHKMSRVHVYTPPGYETMKDKLPVLYLQHGGGDNDASWVTAGKANFILDNLYAEGKLAPMVVVMPYGNPGNGFFCNPGVEEDPYYTYFFQDLLPYIEKEYKVYNTPEYRAYAGLSMGGLQALNMALFYPEQFSYVLPLSTGFFPNNIQLLEEKYADELKNPAINKLKLFWLAMGGEKDIAYQNGVNTKALFKKFGIQYQEHSYPAGHTFLTWRHDLHTFAPLLFK